MKSILLLLLVFTISNLKAEPLQGQAKLDSLLAELPNAKGDTNEVNLLEDISFYFRLNDNKKGIYYGISGLNLAKKINWKNGEAYCLSSIGNNYSRQSNFQKALEYFQKSLKISEEIGDKSGISSALGNIGNIFDSQSKYPEALEYYQKALKINEESGKKKGIANNLGSLGNLYSHLVNYPKSLEYYQKALKIYIELEDKSGISICLGNIGVVYVNQNNYPQALKYFQKSLRIKKELGNISGAALTYSTMGQLYKDMNELDKSLYYLKKGLKLSSEIKDNRTIALILMNISENYMAQVNKLTETSEKGNISSIMMKLKKENLYNDALQFGLRAEKIADSNGIVEYQYLIYETLFYVYKNLKEPWKALEYHEKFTNAKDSIFNQENSDKIAALEKSREDDLKQKEIEKQKIRIAEQEKREKLILYFSIGFFIVMSIVMFVIYRLLKRSDKLLYNVLPVSIAKRLKKKEHPISDYFTQASIVFIDIVNFTELSRDEDPRRIVEALNKIFTHYDIIANKYGLEKIKTIGDRYMAAAGIPEVQKDNTHRAAQMALEVKAMMEDYHTADGTKIEVRIGLDCGPVVAGVIGENKFIYDMWSDAVNTASRMESSSIAGQVHVSERFKEAVTEYEEFDYVERGEIEIKGKGKMKTFFMGSKIPSHPK